MVPPSAWAFSAGMVSGLAFNILVGVRLEEGLSWMEAFLFYTSIALFLFSACVLAGLAVVLEGYRQDTDRIGLRMLIQDKKHSLSRWTMLGALALVAAFAFFFIA